MALVERSLNDALIAYTKGRKVIVLQIEEDGKMDSSNLSDFLEDEKCHYLVDVPAVENPDFKQEVADMVSGKDEEKQAPPPTAPGDVVLPAKPKRTYKKKYDEQELRKYVEAGKSNEEIAKLMGCSKATVVNRIKECGLCGIRKHGGNNQKDVKQEKPAEKKVFLAGHNADRHLCKTCRFRSSKEDKRRGFGCDYIEIVGHSRRCDIEDCDVYEKGDPSQKGKKLTLK